MKEILMTLQKPFLSAAAVLVFLSIIQNRDANKFIDAENEANSSDYRKSKLPRASEGMLIATFVLLLVLLLKVFFFE